MNGLVSMRDGAFLRGYRKACRITQAELARLMSVSVSRISRVERGQEVDRTVYLRMAKKLGLNPRHLWCYRG